MRAFEWAEPEINTYTLVLFPKHVQRKPTEFNPYNFYVALFSKQARQPVSGSQDIYTNNHFCCWYRTRQPENALKRCLLESQRLEFADKKICLFQAVALVQAWVIRLKAKLFGLFS